MKKPSTGGIVKWQVVQEVGEALARSARTAPTDMLPLLLDRLTLPHQLLEQLAGYTADVLAGEPNAMARLRVRLVQLTKACPRITDSGKRAEALINRGDSCGTKLPSTGSQPWTVCFDQVVRLASAVTVASRGCSDEVHDAGLSVITGLVLDTLWLDRLARGFRNRGVAGVPEVLRELKEVGALGLDTPLIPLNFAAASLPGLPPGVPLPGGGIPGRPDDIPDFIQHLIHSFQNPDHWDSIIWDYRPPLQNIFGFGPDEIINGEEILRISCLLDMNKALKLRQEPPPPRPDRIVWSDNITGISSDRVCAGDRVVIQGRGFGPANPDIGLMLPMVDGCLALAVPAADWTDTAITVTIPSGIVSGSVGLVNLVYVQLYDDWVARMNALTERILNDAACTESPPPDVQFLKPFDECAIATPVNHLRAGLPVIRSFRANGRDLAYVEPGQFVLLEWSLQNVERFQLHRSSASGPGFPNAAQIDDPPGNSYALGAFNGNRATEARYHLHAQGPCGDAQAEVRVLLRKVPHLEIVGVEVTQGIQSFWDPDSAPNSLPLVEHKDTIVRVYVAVENLAGFILLTSPDEVSISGELRIPNVASGIRPITQATALPRARIDRKNTDHSLNFRIPAALSASTADLLLKVWTAHEVEAPPAAELVRPTASAFQNVRWIGRSPLRIRYLRVSTPQVPAATDETARKLILRAFDLLPTPPEDIAPARVPVIHTTADMGSRDGIRELVDQIDDLHDCTLSEALFPWEDECPDGDEATWVGVTAGDVWGGSAGTFSLFDTSRNSCAVPLDFIVTAHELGHTLGFHHVNPEIYQYIAPDGPFDELPDNGAIHVGDAFNPSDGVVIQAPGTGSAGLWDMMTYASFRWVSRANWQRLFDKF